MSAHELSTAGNKHVTAHKLDLACADVTDAYIQLDITRAWGDGHPAGTDGTQGQSLPVFGLVTLLRRLGHDSRKNGLYRAFRELGRAVRTLVLLRYLSEPDLRASITAMTNKVEAFHGFADWLMFGGEILSHNDLDHHEKIVKFNELIANCVIYQTTLDITGTVNHLVADGWTTDPDDLATISPYIRENVRRFGEWVLDTTPPEQAVITRLDVALARDMPAETPIPVTM